MKQKTSDNEPVNTTSTTDSAGNQSEAAGVQDAVKEEKEAVPSIQFDSLKSLSDIGIDMSFLPSFGELLEINIK